MLKLLEKLKDAQNLVKSVETEIEIYKYRFILLKPGMIFLEQSGYDYYESEIISIDYENYTYKYKDGITLSTGSSIPYDLYESHSDMMKNKKFKFDMTQYERDKKINKVLDIIT